MTVIMSGSGGFKDVLKCNALSFSALTCTYCQGPAGTRGPEGRQGEKGSKVSRLRVHTLSGHTHVNVWSLIIHTHKRVVSVIIHRETQVPWAPQVKRALWVPKECLENLEAMVFAGCPDQWLVKAAPSWAAQAAEGQHPLRFCVSGRARLSGTCRTERTAWPRGKLPLPPCSRVSCVSLEVCAPHSGPSASPPSAGTSRFAGSARRFRQQRRKRTPGSYRSDWTLGRAG